MPATHQELGRAHTGSQIICSKRGALATFNQEPITRSVQLAYFLATAFSQVGLFLDEAFFCGYILHITVNYAFASDWLLKTGIEGDKRINHQIFL